MDPSVPPIDGPGAQLPVGVVAPFDFALDRELWRWAPGDVTLLLTRTPFVDQPVSIELAEAVSDVDEVAQATANLGVVRPRSVLYACTSGSFVNGPAGERALVDAMLQAGAPSAVTTSGALLDALRLLEVRRVAVATPYVADVTTRLHNFLTEQGIDTVSSAHLGLSAEIWNVPYATTSRLVLEADHPDAQAIFVSCTNLPTYDLIAPLERHLAKPILTANQVSMWAALSQAGAQPVGPGQLLLDA